MAQGADQKSTREPRLADCDMRPATVDDVPAIVATLEAGRALLAADGIDQWQNGTGPDVDLVTEDVERGWGRVFLVDGQVAATAALIDEPEPNYAHMLEGAWQVRGDAAAPAGAAAPYATIDASTVAEETTDSAPVSTSVRVLDAQAQPLTTAPTSGRVTAVSAAATVAEAESMATPSATRETVTVPAAAGVATTFAATEK